MIYKRLNYKFGQVIKIIEMFINKYAKGNSVEEVIRNLQKGLDYLKEKNESTST